MTDKHSPVELPSQVADYLALELQRVVVEVTARLAQPAAPPVVQPEGVRQASRILDALMSPDKGHAELSGEEWGELGIAQQLLRKALAAPPVAPLAPIPLFLTCPMCGTRHIDRGEFATKPHHTHSCQNPKCCLTWRPAVEHTVGVQSLPGFLDATKDPTSCEAVAPLPSPGVARALELFRAARLTEGPAIVHLSRKEFLAAIGVLEALRSAPAPAPVQGEPAWLCTHVRSTRNVRASGQPSPLDHEWCPDCGAIRYLTTEYGEGAWLHPKLVMDVKRAEQGEPVALRPDPTSEPVSADAELAEAGPLHCANCGAHIRVDGDGCCTTCGCFSPEGVSAAEFISSIQAQLKERTEHANKLQDRLYLADQHIADLQAVDRDRCERIVELSDAANAPRERLAAADQLRAAERAELEAWRAAHRHGHDLAGRVLNRQDDRDFWLVANAYLAAIPKPTPPALEGPPPTVDAGIAVAPEPELFMSAAPGERFKPVTDAIVDAALAQGAADAQAVRDRDSPCPPNCDCFSCGIEKQPPGMKFGDAAPVQDQAEPERQAPEGAGLHRALRLLDGVANRLCMVEFRVSANNQGMVDGMQSAVAEITQLVRDANAPAQPPGEGVDVHRALSLARELNGRKTIGAPWNVADQCRLDLLIQELRGSDTPGSSTGDTP